MKIDTSVAILSSDHRLASQDTRTEKLDVWVDTPQMEWAVDRVTISSKPRGASIESSGSLIESLNESVEENPEFLLLQLIIEKLTGRKIKLAKLENGLKGPDLPAIPPSETTAAQPQRSGWGIRYDLNETHIEKEETAFRAGGIVRTKDGREIQFTVNLKMTREFVQSTDIRVRAGDAVLVDPLVINFNGTAAQLTDQAFAFDLDADGQEENIPFVAPGSGVLVFDRNGDGMVNDGTELFGPSTGNAFAELSGYDKNGDRWIDESEAVYQNLFVWTRDGNGNDSLQTLEQAGVGALYTAGSESPFALKDSANKLRGQIVRTGIFLREDGGAGTLQQLNLVI